ncbi:hypothetical protein WJX84_002916 [Apatococcus fuscideae]|uniref:Uncharacterized protein n=1 Tax=Apatococcus fuscideae TaxID=2026836 RepID=A0AAW1T9Z9_9CHLO
MAFWLLTAGLLAIVPVPTTAETFFYLVRQWPTTYCSVEAQCSTDPARNAFSIHGLWPNYDRGGYPENCTNEQYDSSAVSDIRSEMTQAWESYSEPNDRFWAHEWECHGTCTRLGQAQFFRTVLQLNQQYNLEDALQSAGIVPDDDKTYSTADISDAIKEAYGAEPTVRCANRRLRGKQLLDSVFMRRQRLISPTQTSITLTRTLDTARLQVALQTQSLTVFSGCSARRQGRPGPECLEASSRQEAGEGEAQANRPSRQPVKTGRPLSVVQLLPMAWRASGDADDGRLAAEDQQDAEDSAQASLSSGDVGPLESVEQPHHPQGEDAAAEDGSPVEGTDIHESAFRMDAAQFNRQQADLLALWRLYDEGEPHIKRPALRELEAQKGSEWRNRAPNDRKRWSDISRFADEVMRRAERDHTTPVAIIKQMDTERLSQKPKAKPVAAYLKEVLKHVAANRH